MYAHESVYLAQSKTSVNGILVSAGSGHCKNTPERRSPTHLFTIYKEKQFTAPPEIDPQVQGIWRVSRHGE